MLILPPTIFSTSPSSATSVMQRVNMYVLYTHEHNCYIHFCCRGTLESFTQIHRLTVRPLSEDLHWRGVARGNRKQQ